MLLLFFMTNIANAFDINVGKYSTINHWVSTPDIIVCKDSPVTKKQIQKAAAKWNKKGIATGKIKKETKGECKNKHDIGSILVMGPRGDLDTKKWHAVTIRWYDSSSTDDYKLVKSAFIEIDPSTIKNRPNDINKLLTHEIGHALGYTHVHIKNDVMISGIMN